MSICIVEFQLNRWKAPAWNVLASKLLKTHKILELDASLLNPAVTMTQIN